MPGTWLQDIQVLQIPPTEGDVGDDFDLAISGLGDADAVAEIASPAVDFDAVVEELLECGQVEDLVAHGLGAVDCVLLEVWC